MAFDENPSIIKERPAVIMSTGKNIFAVGLKVTSTPPRYGYESIDYRITRIEGTGLDHESVVRLDHAYRLEESDMLYKMGKLHPYDILLIDHKYIKY